MCVDLLPVTGEFGVLTAWLGSLLARRRGVAPLIPHFPGNDPR